MEEHKYFSFLFIMVFKRGEACSFVILKQLWHIWQFFFELTRNLEYYENCDDDVGLKLSG